MDIKTNVIFNMILNKTLNVDNINIKTSQQSMWELGLIVDAWLECISSMMLLAWVIIIIITLYFENVTFFHAKLKSDVCPRVMDQTSGDTLQDSTVWHMYVSKPKIVETKCVKIFCFDFTEGGPMVDASSELK